jgi:Na+/proline symporter
MIILSLFWTGFTERGAIAAMLTGFFMTIVSKFVLQELDGIGAYFGALETMPPSFLAALIVGYLVAMTWPDGQTADRHKALVKRLELSRESHQ